MLALVFFVLGFLFSRIAAPFCFDQHKVTVKYIPDDFVVFAGQKIGRINKIEVQALSWNSSVLQVVYHVRTTDLKMHEVLADSIVRKLTEVEITYYYLLHDQAQKKAKEAAKRQREADLAAAAVRSSA